MNYYFLIKSAQKFLVSLFLTLLVLLFLPNLTSAQTGIEMADRELKLWRLFEPTGGNFRVSLPAQPQGGVMPFETPTATLEVHGFTSKTTSSVYIISYIDLVDDTFKDLKATEAGFDRVRDEVLGRTQSTTASTNSTKIPLSEKKLVLGKFPGRELIFDDGANTIKMQMFLVKQRGYIVAVSAPQTRNLPVALAKVFQAEADKFFNSFQILDSKKSEIPAKGKRNS